IIEEQLVNLSILDEEEVTFWEEASVVDNEFKFCVVGRCLTDWSSGGIFHFVLPGGGKLHSMSRWLREVNGSVCRNLDKKSRDNGRNGRDDRDMPQIWRDDMEKLYLNQNNIPLGPRFEALLRDSVNQKNMDREMGNWAVNVSEPIDLILEEENDPLMEKRDEHFGRVVFSTILKLTSTECGLASNQKIFRKKLP
ncbi:hypothetical protein Golob_001239, partial [Gossypium lobatum]|nr:hypothetical protein [Gossypium lobatum]